MTQFVHGGVTYTPDADGIITINTALGGSFTFDFNTGEYSYTPPPQGALRDDATETFTYTIADGDGDTDTRDAHDYRGRRDRAGRRVPRDQYQRRSAGPAHHRDEQRRRGGG